MPGDRPSIGDTGATPVSASRSMTRSASRADCLSVETGAAPVWIAKRVPTRQCVGFVCGTSCTRPWALGIISPTRDYGGSGRPDLSLAMTARGSVTLILHYKLVPASLDSCLVFTKMRGSTAVERRSGVAQSAVQAPLKREVVGSSPTSRTNARVARVARHASAKRAHAGAIPVPGSTSVHECQEQLT